MKQNALGGAVSAVADFVDGNINPVLRPIVGSPTKSATDSAMHSAGINPDESSEVHGTYHRMTTAAIIASSVVVPEALAEGESLTTLGNVRPTGYMVARDGTALPLPKYRIPDGYVENPNRAGSYGDIVDGKFVERLRLDPPSRKYPSHYHIDNGHDHLYPGSSKGDPGFPQPGPTP